MAGAVGFEPTNADSKNRCLTAWRRPNNSLTLYIILINRSIFNFSTLTRSEIKWDKKSVKECQERFKKNGSI